MKNKLNPLFAALALLALSTLNSQFSSAQAQGTAFTYQGRLNSGTNPASGNFDLTFELFNAGSGGSQVGSTLTNVDVGVTNGVFTVLADFGAVYNGTAYWLQIGVRSNGSGSSFTALSPRQELTPTPYSITAENVTGAIPLAQLPPGLVTNNETGVTLDNVMVGGNLTLTAPATIYSGGNTLIFDDNNNNFYAGLGAGPLAGTGIANTGIGDDALNNNSNGTNNTAVGYESMNNNVTGAYNVAIGERSLFQNYTGNDNTAEGRHAQLSNVAGTDNTANGYEALLNNTNGSYNTADGSGALNGLKYGSNNIALGYQAGNNYTGGASSNIIIGNAGVSGDNNTIRIGSSQTQTYIAGVINGNGSGLTNLLGASLINNSGNLDFFAGQGAGNQTMTGTHNTGVGDQVLTVNTTGVYNSAVGNNALALNTTGGNNTALGVFALWQNTTGNGNTALGADVLAYNTTGSDNTATGIGALENGTTGSYNTGTGYNALANNTSSENTADGANALAANIGGFQNTAVGYAAMNDNTSGSYNTATGAGALGNNTNASYNAAFGAGALGLNGNGSYNTASGADALAFNQTGANNTAAGYAALAFNTTGNNNTAFGYSAMGATFSTSGGNTAVGGESIYYITDGYNNTGEGYQSLEDTSSGVDNVGIGVAALQENTTDSLNTALGTYSLQYMTNGSDNIALGYAAGYDLLSGSGNIYIGNYGNGTESETIRIGQGQAETYLSGVLAIDGGDTNNGLAYVTSGRGNFGGDGPFVFGFNGGVLGTVAPYGYNLTWDFSGNVWVSNNFSTASLTIRGGSDLAEPFKFTSTTDDVPEGAVVVIDEENPGHLKQSSQPYDTRVAGVLSGANGIHPGIQMQQEGMLEGDRNVALTGRVYVQADASNGPIRPGDLLTTSSTPGRAMKVTDHVRAQGAILGKAMTSLNDGKGMVLVLVTLQ